MKEQAVSPKRREHMDIIRVCLVLGCMGAVALPAWLYRQLYRHEIAPQAQVRLGATHLALFNLCLFLALWILSLSTLSIVGREKASAALWSTLLSAVVGPGIYASTAWLAKRKARNQKRRARAPTRHIPR
jgi:hypothetical protein